MAVARNGWGCRTTPGVAARGMAVLAFDFRHFGASEGSPRQVIDVREQREDYRAAADARAVPGIDPASQLLWLP
ncbi:hypothetical protein ACIA5G_25420 [Amycolatopsis sp. NPDC051758]|uniref:hypothetical protein n=1 Tax=Amycolatopsis sp. NPDC051758 TaxID=3363935 RepID=UPI0037A0E689